MKILFLSTHNFATNPRFVKEVKLALDKGFEVEIICFEFNNWSYSFNQQLKEQLSAAKITIIPANRRPFWPWISSVLTEQTNRFLGKLLPLNGKRLSQAVSRRSNLLIREIRKKKGPYDLVVGHNPGALFPAWFAGNLFNCNSGFDIEDYHPGEGNNRERILELEKLLTENLPKMSYLTFASSAIRQKIQTLVPVDGPVVMNYFPAEEFLRPIQQNSGTLKLVWFSQNIASNRGLEYIIPALSSLKNIELHLYGNCEPSFKSTFLNNFKNVFLHPAMRQHELHNELKNYDIGLAVEPGKDVNNDLAVSNKLLAYFQAGLYIIASDTTGQKEFLKDHPNHGKLIDLHSSNLTMEFEKLVLRKNDIRASVTKRFEDAYSFSWETESEKLIKTWSWVISQNKG